MLTEFIGTKTTGLNLSSDHEAALRAAIDLNSLERIERESEEVYKKVSQGDGSEKVMHDARMTKGTRTGIQFFLEAMAAHRATIQQARDAVLMLCMRDPDTIPNLRIEFSTSFQLQVENIREQAWRDYMTVWYPSKKSLPTGQKELMPNRQELAEEQLAKALAPHPLFDEAERQFFTRIDEIISQYEGKWVAVLVTGKIFAANDRKDLEKLLTTENVPRDACTIRRVTKILRESPEETTILWSE